MLKTNMELWPQTRLLLAVRVLWREEQRQPCPVPPLRPHRPRQRPRCCRRSPRKVQSEMGRVYFQSDAPKRTNETSKGPRLPLRSSLASSTAVREDAEILVRPSLNITVENDDRCTKIGSSDATSSLQNNVPSNVCVVPASGVEWDCAR